MESLEVFRTGIREEGKVDEQVGAKNLVCVCEFGDKLCVHVGCWPLTDRRVGELEQRYHGSLRIVYQDMTCER